ncbi:hypothetical protein F4561_005803 [Lipingzhangella halophila]|uniref:Glycine zipper family protein n=1 Tax=Lipingzhangella halophila TaxID=1783352 RepID=A0A7W7RMW1_9ACTN|nr:hypothetical protein [Lipingzhangella halophila]MBB4934909.1 hypothetical protein [Lipingzhangella halophila]
MWSRPGSWFGAFIGVAMGFAVGISMGSVLAGIAVGIGLAVAMGLAFQDSAGTPDSERVQDAKTGSLESGPQGPGNRGRPDAS